MKEIQSAARERLKGWCQVCPICNGRACAEEVPGMGGAGTGEAFKENVRALNAVKLNLRTLRPQRPTVPFPSSHGRAHAQGGFQSRRRHDRERTRCGPAPGLRLDTGTLCWSGDGANPALYDAGLQAITRCDNSGIPTIKPRGRKEIIRRIRMAEEAGSCAIAIDVNTAGFINMTAQGAPIGLTDPADLTAVMVVTRLLVIIKGIMTPDEAVLAASVGAAGIVVSNHGGRGLDSCPSTAAVLPAIADAIRGGIAILVDGGVRSGGDVLKCLALGADAVLVGRPLIQAATGGGAAGIARFLESVKNALLFAMLLTDTARASSVPRRIVTL